ncbi:MAG: PASTA domain-containing protein [Chitinophagales bacterium]|nr:PASTA domain-containing protein [Chitinophagales bacterium]
MATCGVLASLDSYTNHGESITVRDLRGMTIDEVKKALGDSKLEFIVSDSTYQANKKGETVLDQDPKPGAKVKEHRTIYLTINAKKAPKVKMPYLIDKSLRQAISELESRDLKLGEKIYKPDIAKDAVLEQLYNGEPIDSGTMIAKGSTINLVIGSGSEGQGEVPALVGLSYEEAKIVLMEYSLNIGSTVYDGSVSDSASAKIVRTVPEQGAIIKMGEAVDLFFSNEVPENEAATEDGAVE